MILYNLFPLLAGPFAKWDQHFERAKEMSFDWIYINPIQKLGASRSLYSITDYFQINPAFANPGTDRTLFEQCRDMIGQGKQRGLKLMTDLVINHCAYDSS